MAFFSRSAASAELAQLFQHLHEIAEALKTLGKLKKLELEAQGLCVETEDGEGEIRETDPEILERLEKEDELRKLLGLPAHAPVGVIDPATGREWSLGGRAAEAEKGPTAEESLGLFGTAQAWGYGPEGAEDPERGT